MISAKRIKEDELKELIQSFIKDGDSKYSLLLMTASLTGLRVSDITKITWDNLLNDDGEFTVFEEKTGKKRIVNVPNGLQKFALSLYPQCSKNQLIFHAKGHTDKPLTRQSIDKKIKDKTKLLFNKLYSMHSFRKFFAYKVLDRAQSKHIGLETIRGIFNHSSIKITQVYLGIDLEDHREAVMDLDIDLN